MAKEQVVHQEDLMAVCNCGHTRGEHAASIDNQIASSNPAVQRKHCLHDSKKSSVTSIYGCECPYFGYSKPEPDEDQGTT